jgi:hypothetical protein
MSGKLKKIDLVNDWIYLHHHQNYMHIISTFITIADESNFHAKSSFSPYSLTDAIERRNDTITTNG